MPLAAPSSQCASAQLKGYTVTVVNIAGSVYGYDSGAGGAIGPVNTWKGQTVNTVTSNPAASIDFSIVVLGVQVQSLFRYVIVQDSTGAYRRYDTASATFTPGASSLWKWGSGASPVWTAAASRPIDLCE